MAITSSRPTIALVKTRWRKPGERTLAERAGVIGANVWKIALAIYKHLEKEGFRFVSDRMVTDLLAELIAFLVQFVDRTVYGRLSDPDRATLVTEVARHLAATMENNQLDLLGPGEYRKRFIDLINLRLSEYASFDYDAGAPGAPCVLYFATRVADVMAAGDNKWVLEQMIDIETPEMVRVARKLVDQTVDAAPR
jgi:hypothetical protein